jgi:hypothetical protein
MSTTEPSNESEASHPGRLRAMTAYQFYYGPILARSKTAALAEEQSLPEATLTVRNWLNAAVLGRIGIGDDEGAQCWSIYVAAGLDSKSYPALMRCGQSGARALIAFARAVQATVPSD